MWFLYVFTILLFTADLPSLCAGQETIVINTSFQDVMDKLKLYDQDSRGKDFIKLLSWSYDEKLEENLPAFIADLNPTVIAIQNISNEKLASLSDIMAPYEVSGINKDVSDNDIVNPIFYKSERLRPPVSEDKFTGVEIDEKYGQIGWAQFHIVDVSNLKANRYKRDLQGNSMENIFRMLLDVDTPATSCNVPGTMVIINANFKDTNDSPDSLLKPVYDKVHCNRRKKTLLAGNVGWTKSHSAVFNFGKKMLSVKTFDIDNNKRNLNQIWTYDFNMVEDISANIRSYRGDDVTTQVPGKETMINAPTFAAFHYNSITSEK